MSSDRVELAHLFRALKAPAAARALPVLAERAREEQWSYERFAEALLSTEVVRPRQPRRRGPDQGRAVPGPQDPRGVRLHLPTLGQEDGRSSTSASSTSCTPRKT